MNTSERPNFATFLKLEPTLFSFAATGFIRKAMAAKVQTVSFSWLNRLDSSVERKPSRTYMGLKDGSSEAETPRMAAYSSATELLKDRHLNSPFWPSRPWDLASSPTYITIDPQRLSLQAQEKKCQSWLPSNGWLRACHISLLLKIGRFRMNKATDPLAKPS